MGSRLDQTVPPNGNPAVNSTDDVLDALPGEMVGPGCDKIHFILVAPIEESSPVANLNIVDQLTVFLNYNNFVE